MGHNKSADANPRSRGVICPSRARTFSLERIEGAGKAGCPLHPQPRVGIKNHTSIVTTGSPETPSLPCAMALTVSFVLSPVTGLFCHRRLRIAPQLDASVGASGPHDFSVRINAARLRRYRVHRIPRPTSVTIAIRPSYRGGMARNLPLIWG